MYTIVRAYFGRVNHLDTEKKGRISISALGIASGTVSPFKENSQV
jgi:hypothetical protein